MFTNVQGTNKGSNIIFESPKFIFLNVIFNIKINILISILIALISTSFKIIQYVEHSHILSKYDHRKPTTSTALSLSKNNCFFYYCTHFNARF
jgi:hypothetical protein